MTFGSHADVLDQLPRAANDAGVDVEIADGIVAAALAGDACDAVSVETISVVPVVRVTP